MKVALYSRVSTRDKKNPEMQLSELRRYSALAGLTVALEAFDKALGSPSARSSLKQILKSKRRGRDYEF